jgi:hypothetical protein
VAGAKKKTSKNRLLHAIAVYSPVVLAVGIKEEGNLRKLRKMCSAREAEMG